MSHQGHTQLVWKILSCLFEGLPYDFYQVLLNLIQWLACGHIGLMVLDNFTVMEYRFWQQWYSLLDFWSKHMILLILLEGNVLGGRI